MGIIGRGLRPIQVVGGSLRRAAARARYAFDQWRYRSWANGLPIPPARLNHLVTATQSVRWYVEAGRWAFTRLMEVFEKYNVDYRSFRAVLDFGCGSGRVIRYWKDFPGEIHGSDYNPDLIRWCRANLPFARFETNRLQPPLAYPDAKFDFVYALSVFTHLDEPGQYAWMREMYRVLKPGGYLFITTQGGCQHYLNLLNDQERARFHCGRLVVQNEDLEGENACKAFHPYEFVKDELARDFQIRVFIPEGASGNPPQDAYLLRKPFAAGERQAA